MFLTLELSFFFLQEAVKKGDIFELENNDDPYKWKVKNDITKLLDYKEFLIMTGNLDKKKHRNRILRIFLLTWIPEENK